MRGRDRINSSLSDELILEIFSHVYSKLDRDSCSLVCKRWLALEGLSRTSLNLGTAEKSGTFVKLLARRFPNLTSICIDEELSFGRRRMELRARDPERFLSEANMLPCLSCIGDCFPQLQKLKLIWCPGNSSPGLVSIANKCSSLKSLKLEGSYVGDHGLASVGKCCKKLEVLNLRLCVDLTEYGLVELALGCGESLKSLKIASCENITDKSMEAVGSYCKSLERLSLDSCPIKGVQSVAQGCPSLKALTLRCVTDEALMAVGSHCQSLESLALYHSKQLTDRGLCAIGDGCKKLKNLTLSDRSLLSDKGLEAIATCCIELTHLEVSGCHNIWTLGLEAIGKFCPCLTKLVLLDCQEISSHAFLEIGKGCKFLQDLDLVDCPEIDDDAICDIAEGCKYLKKLRVRSCYKVGNKGIIAIAENCKYLKDLNLRYCDRVGDEALIAVAQGCSLHSLTVYACCLIGDAGIIAIARGCPELRYIEACKLPNLGDMALVELGEGCPLLREVVLNVSQITDKGLAHLVRNLTLLETLEVLHCCGITSIGVATVVSTCPNLTEFVVDEAKISERTRRRAGSVFCCQ